MMAFGKSAFVFLMLCLPSISEAADHSIAGDKIRITDPADPARRRFFFRTIREPEILATMLDDPRVVSASLEVTGTNAGDGATGTLILPAMTWKGLGSPAGTNGYLYYDRTAPSGVTKVLLRPGQPGGRGGTLAITGRGINWPYTITQPQGPISLRFTVGTTTYCAQFVDLAHNRVGSVLATRAAPPPMCN